MSLPDSLSYTRKRTRQIEQAGGVASDRSVFDQTFSNAPSEKLIAKETTWDRDNSWEGWQTHLANVRKSVDYANLRTAAEKRRYLSRLRMTDIGGPFHNVKESIETDEKVYDLYFGSGSYSRMYGYRGPLAARYITNSALRAGLWVSEMTPSSELELDELGTVAISRCAPTSPHASLWTTIGEIRREGLPSVPGLQALKGQKFKDTGGEYLNYQFGLIPVYNDMKSLYQSTRRMTEILDQYYRDSGRLVRRSYSFPDQVSSFSNIETGAGAAPAALSGAHDPQLMDVFSSSRTTTTTITTKRWFSGAFTYHAGNKHPSAGKLEEQLKKWNHLYGILPTPEAIWNLQPWSWAVDWVTNVGDVLGNASMFLADGLVMPYGYIMEHKLEDVEIATSVNVRLNGNWSRVTTTQRFRRETKRRRAATPFGFGLELDGFTGRQWAILAALGITKSGR